jgi:hypothetical protein
MAEKLQIIIQAQDRFSKAFGRLKGTLPSLKTAAVGATAAFAALGGAFAAMVKTTANAYDQTAKLGTQLGVTTEFLSSMQYAADLSGIRIGTLNKSIAMLQVRIGEAGRGIGEAKNAFESLGVSLVDANGEMLTAEQIMPRVADAFNNMGNATSRAEAASKIFGQRGMAMLQMFKNGSAGLREMTAEAEKFGLIISGRAAANAEEFNDSLTRVTGAFKGIKNAIAEQFFPELARSSNKLAEWIAQNREMIAINVAEWFRNVGQMIIYVGNAFKWVDDNITDNILQFFFGPTKTPSKIELLNKQIEIARNNIHDYYVALAAGEQPEKEFLQLQENKIKLLEFEIAALKTRNKLKGEGDKPKPPTAPDGSAELIITPAFKPFEPLDFIDSTAGIKAAQDEIKGIQALWNQHYLTQRELIDLEYRDKSEKLKTALANDLISQEEHNTALANLDAIRDDKKGAIRTAEVEAEAQKFQALQETYNEHFQTQDEQLNAWYSRQLELFAGNEEAKELLKELYLDRAAEIDEARLKQMQQAQATAFNNLATIASAAGKQGFKLSQGIAIAQATMKAHEAYNVALATPAPWPIPLVFAGLALAAGLAQVAQIAAQAPPKAHGGLTNVPADQTYLLARNERVISPQQNKDLTEFLKKTQSGGTGLSVENLNFEILPNATNLEGLMAMDKNEWRDLIEDKIIDGIKDLKAAGITI